VLLRYALETGRRLKQLLGLRDAEGAPELLQFDKPGVRGYRVVQAVEETREDEKAIKKEVSPHIVTVDMYME
jgi:hypothetical protein